LREQRRAELERHVDEVNAMLRPSTSVGGGDENESDEEDEGSRGSLENLETLPAVNHEAEYIDEDKYTTVHVETMDISKEALSKAHQAEDAPDHGAGEDVRQTLKDGSSERSKRQWTKEKPKADMRKRKKKRNFKYEGRAERKEARSKENSRNRKQARERRSAGRQH
jgi:ribosomal RNA-processing protein 17